MNFKDTYSLLQKKREKFLSIEQTYSRKLSNREIYTKFDFIGDDSVRYYVTWNVNVRQEKLDQSKERELLNAVNAISKFPVDVEIVDGPYDGGVSHVSVSVDLTLTKPAELQNFLTELIDNKSFEKIEKFIKNHLA